MASGPGLSRYSLIHLCSLATVAGLIWWIQMSGLMILISTLPVKGEESLDLQSPLTASEPRQLHNSLRPRQLRPTVSHEVEPGGA